MGCLLWPWSNYFILLLTQTVLQSDIYSWNGGWTAEESVRFCPVISSISGLPSLHRDVVTVLRANQDSSLGGSGSWIPLGAGLWQTEGRSFLLAGSGIRTLLSYYHLALGFRESLLPSLDVFTAVFAICTCVEGHTHSISFLYILYSNGVIISEVGKSGLWTNLPLGLSLKVILLWSLGREVDRTMFSQWCVTTIPFRVDLHSLHRFLVNLYPVPTLGWVLRIGLQLRPGES